MQQEPLDEREKRPTYNIKLIKYQGKSRQKHLILIKEYKDREIEGKK